MRSGLLIMLLTLLTPAWAQVTVRVLLDEVQTPVVVTMGGAHRGYLGDALTFTTPSGLSWPLQAVQGQIVIDGAPVGRSFTLEPADGSFVTWNATAYRGALRFVAEKESLKVINVVDLEAYLRGVVPAEMQASWSLEALKAQAVAARTYTLTDLHPEADVDLCATIECQKYSGVKAEHPRSDEAIRDTAGLVLTYGGTFARTYYHSDSGGVLASSAEVWGNALPYLGAQADVDSSTPHRRWERVLDPSLIARSLQTRGLALGEVVALRVLAYSDSGRVSRLEVTGTLGRTVLSGPSLTKVLREWGLKSTRFVLTGNLSVRGDGWGHGVGMSQYGAKTLAAAGYSYAQILGFYYPATELGRLEAQPAPP